MSGADRGETPRSNASGGTFNQFAAAIMFHKRRDILGFRIVFQIFERTFRQGDFGEPIAVAQSRNFFFQPKLLLLELRDFQVIASWRLLHLFDTFAQSEVFLAQLSQMTCKGQGSLSLFLPRHVYRGQC